MSAKTTSQKNASVPEPAPGLLERLFRLSANKTTVRTEITAGFTTFFASVFTVIAIPGMLAGGAMNAVGGDVMNTGLINAVYIAAVLASILGSLLLAFLANLPFVQAPGMGLGAYLSGTVMPAIAVLALPRTLTDVQVFQMSVALVFISGSLFILMTATGVRERIINGIPRNIKVALASGIGLFITLLGLRQTGITRPSPGTFVTMVDFGNWDNPIVNPAHGPVGSQWAHSAILGLGGFLLIVILSALKVKGAVIIGILATTVMSYVTGFTPWPQDFSLGLGERFSDFANYGFFRLDFGTFFDIGDTGHVIAVIMAMVLAHTLVNALDSLGTIFGVATSAGMTDAQGNVVGLEKGLLSDAIGTAGGALLGSSSTATVVSSASGIKEGGRTGLTSLTVSALFVVALFFAPFVQLIPLAAVGPALMYVGCLMMGQIKEVDFSDITEGVPAFLAIAIMPLTFSIAHGIAFALISYVLLKLFTGRWREISIPAAVIGLLFVLQYIVN